MGVKNNNFQFSNDLINYQGSSHHKFIKKMYHVPDNLISNTLVTENRFIAVIFLFTIFTKP